jgi:hypothetical protein
VEIAMILLQEGDGGGGGGVVVGRREWLLGRGCRLWETRLARLALKDPHQP